MANPILIKLGIEAVKDPKKTLKIILGIIGGIVGFIILVGLLFELLFSPFVGEELNDDFIVEDSFIYQQTEKAWDRYQEELEKNMDEQEEKILAEYEEKGELVEITRQINKINFAYVTAYLAWINEEFLKANSRDEVIYDEDGVNNFIKQISVLYVRTISAEVQATPSEGIEYTQEEIEQMTTKVILYNRVASPETAAEYVAQYIPEYDDMVQDYIDTFNLHVEIFGEENIFNDGMFYDGIPIDYMGDQLTSNNFYSVPLYYQQDYKDKYGAGTISTSGCGPTSVAMVFSYILQEDLTPDKVVDWTGDKYYYYDPKTGEGKGSTWSLFTGCADHWDITCNNLGMDTDKVFSELEAGHIVIASMGAGTFTSGGHFIVLAGTVEGNKFKVNDPNKYNNEKFQTPLFDCNLVFNEAKNFWSFY